MTDRKPVSANPLGQCRAGRVSYLKKDIPAGTGVPVLVAVEIGHVGYRPQSDSPDNRRSRAHGSLHTMRSITFAESLSAKREGDPTTCQWRDGSNGFKYLSGTTHPLRHRFEPPPRAKWLVRVLSTVGV